MSTKKTLYTFIILIAIILTIPNLSNLTVQAWQETDRVSMSSIDLPIVLIMIIMAGVIGAVVFIIIAAADGMARRRRPKFSCIQH